jgi:hypothetical protein
MKHRYGYKMNSLVRIQKSTLCLIGCIAQLVEHWAFNLMVAGSSPAIPIERNPIVLCAARYTERFAPPLDASHNAPSVNSDLSG